MITEWWREISFLVLASFFIFFKLEIFENWGIVGSPVEVHSLLRSIDTNVHSKQKQPRWANICSYMPEQFRPFMAAHYRDKTNYSLFQTSTLRIHNNGIDSSICWLTADVIRTVNVVAHEDVDAYTHDALLMSFYFSEWQFGMVKGLVLLSEQAAFYRKSRRWRCFELINCHLSSPASRNTPLWLKGIHFFWLVIRAAQICVPQGGGKVIAYGPISCPALLANVVIQYSAVFTPSWHFQAGSQIPWRERIVPLNHGSIPQGHSLSIHHKEKTSSNAAWANSCIRWMHSLRPPGQALPAVIYHKPNIFGFCICGFLAHQKQEANLSDNACSCVGATS